MLNDIFMYCKTNICADWVFLDTPSRWDGWNPIVLPLTLPTAFWKKPYFPLSCSKLCNYNLVTVEHRTINRAYIRCLQVTSRRSLAICKLPRSLAFQAMHLPVRVRRMIACETKHPRAKVCPSAHSCLFGCFKSQMPLFDRIVYFFIFKTMQATEDIRSVPQPKISARLQWWPRRRCETNNMTWSYQHRSRPRNGRGPGLGDA